MSHRRIYLAISVLLLAAGALLALPGRAAQAQTGPTVRVTGGGLDPQVVTVPAGGRVTWLNQTGQTVRLVDGEPARAFLPFVRRDDSAQPAGGAQRPATIG